MLTTCTRPAFANRIRTLLVDDSAVALRTMMSMLDRCGRIEVVGTAADGEEALRRFRELRPELILMDIQMPRVNGFESAAQIRKQCPRAHIVHLTTHEAPEIEAASRASGANRFLAKSRLPQAFCDLFCECFGACPRDDEDSPGDLSTPVTTPQNRNSGVL